MGSTFALYVPEEEQTIETGEKFYQYHVERSQFDSTLDDLNSYESFKDWMKQHDKFRIGQKPTKEVLEASDPPIPELYFEYSNDDGVIWDAEGLDEFIESLETARETLSQEIDDEEHMKGVDRSIEICIHLLEFAKENEYGITI